MKSIGFPVEWRSYSEQGHWYKIPEEIDDIVAFIQAKVKWTLQETLGVQRSILGHQELI